MNETKRTIRVTGRGKLSVKPDMVRLIITQTEREKAYDDAVKASTKQKKALTDAIAGQGFKREDLKTLSFDVRAEYEGYEAKDKSWKQRLVGYRYTHRMKLEFPVESGKLGSVLSALMECKGEPEFTIQYTISDPDGAKNELLAKAVADSRAKAEVLAGAAGVTLGEIIFVDYSWGEIDFVTTPMRDMRVTSSGERGLLMAKNEPLAPDIEPDDIDVTDTVTVVWGIS